MREFRETTTATRAQFFACGSGINEHLKVFGLARGRGHRRFLRAKKRIDGRRLPHVWIPRQAHHNALAATGLQKIIKTHLTACACGVRI
jgi:hypothetical protein